jgi:hypothetical protein
LRINSPSEGGTKKIYSKVSFEKKAYETPLSENIELLETIVRYYDKKKKTNEWLKGQHNIDETIII